MIFYAAPDTSSAPAWLDNHDTAPTIPFRFDLPSGVSVRVEGRNASTDSPTLVGFAYKSGTLVCPFFRQYRITRVRSTSGTVWTDKQIDRDNPAANSVRFSPALQYRGRVGAKGIRKGGLRHSLSLPFDLLPATAGSIGSDRSQVIGPATASKDYTNCRSGETQSGESSPYSIKINSPVGTSGEFRYDFRASSGGPGPINITGGTGLWPTILVKAWVDPAMQAVQSGPLFKLTLGFQDSSGVAANVTLANFQQFSSSAVCGPGWNILLAQPTAAGMGAINPASIDMFRFYIQPNAGVAASLTIDSCHFLTNTGAKKLISFRDDDGYADCWKTAAEFDKKGIRGNFHVLPGLIDTSGYVSLADLRAMQRNGHMIGSHGWSKYPGDALSGDFYQQRTQTPEAYWNDNIYPAMCWLQDNGFEQGSRIYATHQGNMTPDQRELLFENGIDIISNTSTSAEQAAFTNHLDFLEWQHACGYGPTISLATLDILDAQGGLAVFFGHANRSKENANMQAVMNRAVPLIKDGTYRCVTIAEMVAGLGVD